MSCTCGQCQCNCGQDVDNCKHEKTQLIVDLGLEMCCECGLILVQDELMK